MDDASLSISLIKDEKTCNSSFTLTGNIDEDTKIAFNELERMRAEAVSLPDDPFLVLPENIGSSREDHSGDLLNPEDAVSALSPAMRSVDLAGIWASGQIIT